MLRVSEVLAERHPNPVAFAGYAQALALNGRPAEAVAPLELALRLSPRDALRAEWQYRLAFAHFMLNQYEQARDWGQMAQIYKSRSAVAAHPCRGAGAFGKQGGRQGSA